MLCCLICLGDNNYIAPLVIPSPLKFKGHKCKQWMVWCRLFCTFAVHNCFTSCFYDKVSVAPWHHPPHHPLLHCWFTWRGWHLKAHTCWLLLLASNIFPSLYTQSYVVKIHQAAWLQTHTPAVHGLWCTTYPYPIAKALCCVVRSHYGGHMQPYISYTGDYSIFDSYSCSHLPRSPACSISTCDLPSVNIKGSRSDPWTGNFLFSIVPSDSDIPRGFSPEHLTSSLSRKSIIIQRVAIVSDFIVVGILR